MPSDVPCGPRRSSGARGADTTRPRSGPVAELREVLPDAQQRLLRRILGEVDDAQDPARHCEEPVRNSEGKVGIRRLVTSLGSNHEIGIHRLFRMCGTDHTDALTTVWDVATDGSFNLYAR